MTLDGRESCLKSIRHARSANLQSGVFIFPVGPKMMITLRALHVLIPFTGTIKRRKDDRMKRFANETTLAPLRHTVADLGLSCGSILYGRSV